MRVHMDGTTPNENQIFVFGSNLAGVHGGGAARYARDKLGARWGVSTGFTGMCYAIPTKDENIETLPIDRIRPFVDEFVRVAEQNPQIDFFVTRIGCVLAGYSDAAMARLFRGARRLTNIDWPQPWAHLLLEPEAK